MGVYLLGIEDGTEISVGPSDQANMSPLWSHDGRNLLFKGNRDGSYHFWTQHFQEGRAVGDAVRIKADVGPRTMLVRVLDDGRLVYSSWSPGTGVYRQSVNTETGEAVGKPELIIEGRGGAPSPDGRWLAYNSFDWGSGSASALGLRVVSLDGREERTLQTGLVNPFVFGWFPDSGSLLLGGFEASGKRGIYRLELGTGKLETFYTADAFISNGRLSPDGRMVAFGKGKQVYVIKAEVGAEPVLLHSDPDERGIDPSWSPDGRTIAIGAQHRVQPFSRILIIPVNGGEPKEIVRHNEEEIPKEYQGYPRLWKTAWSSNGKFIVYLRSKYSKTTTGKLNSRQEVWLVRTTDGEAFHLKELGKAGSHMHWSADGEELFYTSVDPEGNSTEYWTLQNYLPEETRAEVK